MVHFHSKQLCVAEVTHSSTLAMRWIWAISICCSRSMGEAIGYYNSITTHRYHKETIRHSFTAHYIISLRCTLFEFYIPKSTGIAPTQAMYYRGWWFANSERCDVAFFFFAHTIPAYQTFADKRKLNRPNPSSRRRPTDACMHDATVTPQAKARVTRRGNDRTS